MDNKDKKKDILNCEVDKTNIPNDYKVLLEKLKSIRKIINLLEKKFLEKKI